MTNSKPRILLQQKIGTILTTSYEQGTVLFIHWKIRQIHLATGFDCQPENRERGKKNLITFFHVFMYSVYRTLLAWAMLGIWVPAPNASYHTHVHGSLGMSLVGIFGAKNIFGERLFSSLQFLGINLYKTVLFLQLLLQIDMPIFLLKK